MPVFPAHPTPPAASTYATRTAHTQTPPSQLPPPRPELWPLALANLFTLGNVWCYAEMMNLLVGSSSAATLPLSILVAILILSVLTAVQCEGSRPFRNFACVLVVIVNLPALLGWFLGLYILFLYSLPALAATAFAIGYPVNHAGRMTAHETAVRLLAPPRAPALPPDDEIDIDGAWDQAKPRSV